MKEDLIKLIGTCPLKESEKFRLHQGWWRAFVLKEKEGQYTYKGKNKEIKTGYVCNRINDEGFQGLNFLSDQIIKIVSDTLNNRIIESSGIIDKERLYNNLLSSQPLAFNFMGFLKANPNLALRFIRKILPEVTQFETIEFEFAPKESRDHSAFDFAFIVNIENKRGIIGFECKYTDEFSYKRPKTNSFYGDCNDKNYDSYSKIFNTNIDRFLCNYEDYVSNKYFNQLFRNELLATLFKSEFDFIKTGLFCHQNDKQTINSGNQFQKMIGNKTDDFIILTYQKYFEILQQLDLTWEEREFTMLLWARYCGLQLSKGILKSK